MISEVTLTEFQKAYPKLSEKDKGRVILVEDSVDRDGWIVATFVANREIVELPPEDVEGFYQKYRSKVIYKLLPVVPTVPEYLKEYRNDSDDIKQVQQFCKELVEEAADKEKAERVAAEIVGYYRLSERAGMSVAEMLMKTEKALEQYEGPIKGNLTAEELDEIPIFTL